MKFSSAFGYGKNRGTSKGGRERERRSIRRRTVEGGGVKMHEVRDRERRMRRIGKKSAKKW